MYIYLYIYSLIYVQVWAWYDCDRSEVYSADSHSIKKEKRQIVFTPLTPPMVNAITPFNDGSQIDAVKESPITQKSLFKDVILHEYHPIWNVAFMSTGICACELFNFSYKADWLRYCGLIMWVISLLLFLMVNIFTLAKIWFIKGSLKQLVYHPTHNLFWGPYSMGFSTIVNMIHLLDEHYDLHFGIGANVFWWINAFIAIIISWGVVFIMFTHLNCKKFELHELNAIIVLPVLPMTVMGSSGALVVSGLGLDDRNLKLTIIIITFLSWSYSVFVGSCFICIFFLKLLVSKLPPVAGIFGLFAPIGLLAHAAWGIVLNGNNLRNYIVDYYGDDYQQLSLSILVLFLFIGLFFIAVGFFFTFLSIGSVISKGYIQFNKSFWTMPFPLAALSLALNEVYITIGGEFTVFRVISAIYGALAVVVCIFCLVCSVIYEVPWDSMKKVRLENSNNNNSNDNNKETV